jgi:hypothetical protein
MSVIDLEKLLCLRLVVARLGEFDHARWWNSRGQLGRLGATALKRGFPRTYRFAQARSVFAIAAHRCAEVFDPPGCVTLWHLPEATEEEFESIRAYKAQHAIGASHDDTPALARPRRRSRAPNPAHNEALAQLRAFGVRV